MRAEVFPSYSPLDVILKNLGELEERFSLLNEQKEAHLRELALELLTDEPDRLSFLTTLPDQSVSIRSEIAEHLKEKKDVLQWEHLRFSETADKVRLCREICRILSKDHPIPISFFFPSPDDSHQITECRIAYQKSIAADDAFLKFSQVLPNPRVWNSHTFASICEEVVAGRCEFCILPMESAAEGRLNSFSHLIDRYGLHIAMTATVENADKTRSTRFALLRQELRLPVLEDAPNTALELSVTPYAEHPIEEILLSASLCGLHLEQMDTIPSSYEDGKTVFHPRFNTVEAELCTFLAYLAMEAPHCEIVGYFPNLK